jgi:DNA polymerase-4
VALARGIDDRVVHTRRAAPKSMGHSTTFSRDLRSRDEIQQALSGLADKAATRARRGGFCGRGVTLTVRYTNFQTITRASLLDLATDETDVIFGEAWRMFCEEVREGTPVRLVGVTLTRLVPEAQAGGIPSLFDPVDPSRGTTSRARRRQIDSAMDTIRGKFGGKAILRGRDIATEEIETASPAGNDGSNWVQKEDLPERPE